MRAGHAALASLLLAGACAVPPTEPAAREVMVYPGAAHPERGLPQDDVDVVRWAARMATAGWSSTLSTWVRRATEQEASPACPFPGDPAPTDGSSDEAELLVGDGCTSWGGSLWFGQLQQLRIGEIPGPPDEGELPPAYDHRHQVVAEELAVLHPEPSRSSVPELLSLDGVFDIVDRRDDEGCRERETSVDMRVHVYDTRDRLARRLPSVPLSVTSDASYGDCGASVEIVGALSGPGGAPELSWFHAVAREVCPLEPLEGEVLVTWSEGVPTDRSPPSTYRVVFDGAVECDECIDWYRDDVFMGQVCTF